MAKARVTWAFQERPVSSTKMNQIITDYITPALPVWSYWFATGFDDAAPALSIQPHGFWPYNPQKSVFDRMYILGGGYHNGNIVNHNLFFDVTFDGGSTWTPAFPSTTVAPVDLGGGGPTWFEVWNLSVQVATFQWIGWRFVTLGTADDEIKVAFQGFLYHSTNTPF